MKKMRHLDLEKNRLKDLFLSEKSKLIFLDFDGTLVPIASKPDAIHFDAKTKKILTSLVNNRHIHLVIISGRTLKDLSSYVGSKNMTLAGNHGLEVKGRGVQLPIRARQARKLNHLIRLMFQKFTEAFNCYTGVWVENKHYTLSIHYRNLPQDQEIIFKELVRFFKEKYDHYPVLWTYGKKVVEIRPSVYWGKGDTVMYFMKKFRKAIPIAIGDDKADEDMFRVLNNRRGISVRVGRSSSSLADYYLRSPLEVRDFLQKLCL